jgi:hypothetical protein
MRESVSERLEGLERQIGKVEGRSQKEGLILPFAF